MNTRRTFFGMLAALPFAAWAAVTAKEQPRPKAPAPVGRTPKSYPDLKPGFEPELYERMQHVARGEQFWDWCYVKEATLPFMRRAAAVLDLRLVVDRDGWSYLTGPCVTWVRERDVLCGGPSTVSPKEAYRLLGISEP